ncbi:MAG: thioredoxin domain-containing protein, partial [Acidobacteria bacterium]|nr:thioredoxin domain-containing protein [Acidobacteriota bacterium]
SFYSATDADSPGPDGRRDEGWFFTWTPQEIKTVVGKDRARVVLAMYGVTSQGNFGGRNILHVQRPLDALSRDLRMTPRQIESIRDESRDLLYAARSRRPAPGRDEKILTGWNGLMISAFARAAIVLGDERYAQEAERAADVILNNRGAEGRLLRDARRGATPQEAFLDDYAFFTAALLDLFETSGNPRWLREALALDAFLQRHYEDPEAGGFFQTGDEQEKLLAREKPAYDGAEPSGNSVAVLNLLRLHEITTQDRFRERAEKALRAFGGILQQSPSMLSHMLNAVDFRLDTPKEVVIVTPHTAAEAEPFISKLRGIFLPSSILVVASEGGDLEEKAKLTPLLEGKVAQKGKATAYVCEKRVCALPTVDPELFGRQIRKVEPLPR